MTIFDPADLAPIIPVVVINDPAHAVPLAEALLAGGTRSIEITFRTKAAAESIRLIHENCPDMIIGAGTVTLKEELKTAFDHGAQFAVAPGTSPKIVTFAKELGIPFFPGVANPSDIEMALGLGCQILKFFPAEAIGGVKMLKAIAAPYQHRGVRFIPTGGITEQNFLQYLELNSTIAAGGSWIADSILIERNDWEEITARSKAVVELFRNR